MWDDGWSPDPDLEFLAVFWAHTARTLIARVRAFDECLAAQSPDDPGPLVVADSWQSIADTHFAFVSLVHVARVCDLVPELPGFPDAEILVLLRNFAEHWDDPGGRSGRTLSSRQFDQLGVGNLWLGAYRYIHGPGDEAVDAWLIEVDRVAHSLVTVEEPMPDPSDGLY